MRYLLCKIGFHKWGEIKKYPIELTNFDFLFCTWGVQQGRRKCDLCGCEQKMHREGWVGNNVGEPKWIAREKVKDGF